MKLADLPWTAVRDLLGGDKPVVAILPCGAVEAHGPHLPLATDVIISEGIATRALPLLRSVGIHALVLPSLAYAPAHYAEAFAGTISIGEESARAVILDIARSLKAQGFACLGLANSHFDPANVKMLREAAAAAGEECLPIAFPDFTRRMLAASLTDEFVSGACHAGQFETSLVLADRPDLVGPHDGLAGNPNSLIDAFAKGAATFAEAGGPDAYFGTPAGATAEEGHNSAKVMGLALAASIREALGR